MDYRILGPLEVWDGERSISIPGAKERALLALLLLHAGRALSAERLVVELWGEHPPRAARKSLQVRVASLRKALGSSAVATTDAGYALDLADSRLDLVDFELALESGRRLLADERPDDAAAALEEALALWRGAPLADFQRDEFAQAAIARLDELRLLALELRTDAELLLGHEARLVVDLRPLVDEHPFHEGLRAQLMVALYRSGRQAEALAEFRRARSALSSELGIEPGTRLRELEQAMLRQDDWLHPPVAQRAPSRAVLLGGLETTPSDTLLVFGEMLARGPVSELIVTELARTQDELPAAAARAAARCSDLAARGTDARAAALVRSGSADDLVTLARHQNVALLLVDPPASGVEDPRLRDVLEAAPCDVGIAFGPVPEGFDPVLVAFAGGEHDWAAIELGAWIARATGGTLHLAGPTGSRAGASRSLANASLAVQRAYGITCEPRLVEPDAEALVEVTSGYAVVLVGVASRWQADVLGSTRWALARSGAPTLVVRSGTRPGGLAPSESLTRFTWTVGPAGQ